MEYHSEPGLLSPTSVALPTPLSPGLLDLSICSSSSSSSPTFPDLLTTSASRLSVQMGRHLSEQEMGVLEEELEREIRQQMKEEEEQEKEQQQQLDDAESKGAGSPLKKTSPLKQLFESIAALKRSSPVKTPAKDATAAAALMAVAAAGQKMFSPTKDEGTQTKFSPAKDTEAEQKEPSGSNKDSSEEKVSSPKAFTLVTSSASRRKSFLERASAIMLTPSPARRSMQPVAQTSQESSDKQQQESTPHKRSASEAVAAKLLTSPNAGALRSCMRAAISSGSPLPSSLAQDFAMVQSSPSSALDGGAAKSKIPVLKRAPESLTEGALLQQHPFDEIKTAEDSTSSSSALSSGEPEWLDDSRSELLSRLSIQHAQIHQAGQLGQQLISEMESLESEFERQLAGKDAELRAKERDLEEALQRCERAERRERAKEQQREEWKAQVQQGLEAIEVLSGEVVRAQARAMEKDQECKASARKMDELETERSKQHEEEMQAEKKRSAETLRAVEARLASLTASLESKTEDLLCATRDLSLSQESESRWKAEAKARAGEVQEMARVMDELRCVATKAEEAHHEEVSRLHAIVESLTGERDHSAWELTQSRAQLIEQQERLEKEQERCERVRGERDALQGRIDEAEAAVEVAAAASVQHHHQQQQLHSPRLSSSASSLHPSLHLSSSHKSSTTARRSVARLQSMQYSSLLSELESELEQEIVVLMSSPKNQKKRKSESGPDSVVLSPKARKSLTATTTVTISPPKVLEQSSVVSSGAIQLASPRARKSKAKSLSPAAAGKATNTSGVMISPNSIVNSIHPIPAVEPLSPPTAALAAALHEKAASLTQEDLIGMRTELDASIVSQTLPQSILLATPSRPRADSAPAPRTILRGNTERDSSSEAAVAAEGRKPETISSFLAGAARRLSTPSARASTPSSTAASTQQKQPQLRLPSSAQRLSSWFGEKVREVENVIEKLGRDDLEDEDGESVKNDKTTSAKATPAALSVEVDSDGDEPAIVDDDAAEKENTPPDSASSVMEAAPMMQRSQSESDVRTVHPEKKQPASAGGSDRPDVLREYFHLATLAVKLSSADENLKACNYSVHALYTEAISRDIPFARWHAWIEWRLREISAEAKPQECLRPRTPGMMKQIVRKEKNPQQKQIPASPAGSPLSLRPGSLPLATPGKTPLVPLQPIPVTPAGNTQHKHNGGGAGGGGVGRSVISATPIRIASFDGTPKKGAPVKHQQQLQATAVLGENRSLTNTSLLPPQTPSNLMAQKPLSTPSLGGSVHRPLIKTGAERLQLRTPTAAAASSATAGGNQAGRSQNTVQRVAIPTPSAAQQKQQAANPPRPAPIVTPTSNSLLSSFYSFVTSAPAATQVRPTA